MKKSPTNTSGWLRVVLAVGFIAIAGTVSSRYPLLTVLPHVPKEKAERPNNRPHPKKTPTPTPGGPSPTPTPTPSPNPIPHGNRGFSVSSSNPGPVFGRGSIEPYDPSIGITQALGIDIANPIPIRSAAVTLHTDTATQVYPLELVSGTTTDGTWKASWTVSDTYLYRYKATITAVSDNGTNTITMTLR